MKKHEVMMQHIMSLLMVVPLQDDVEQWLADTDATIDYYHGDVEAGAFLSTVRSVLVLLTGLNEKSVEIVERATVLAQHAERYADPKNPEHEKLAAMKALWATMGGTNDAN